MDLETMCSEVQISQLWLLLFMPLMKLATFCEIWIMLRTEIH